MAAKRKTIIGDVACPVCGRECAVRSEDGDETKTLGYPCSQGCDSPNWAPAGTEAHRIILGKMRRRGAKQEAAPVPDAKADPVPGAKPAPKQPATMFG